MTAKSFYRLIFGCFSGSETNQRPKQVRPHEPSASSSSFYSRENGYEVHKKIYYMGNEKEDVDKASEFFIDSVHKDFKLQKCLSDAEYNGYLARAT
ncbi:hypothetical protein SUGI_0429280 [Cryptomeria japonica]|nr:hypothetical protein SUGI_0429280 [Cryptomeria japonica]